MCFASTRLEVRGLVKDREVRGNAGLRRIRERVGREGSEFPNGSSITERKRCGFRRMDIHRTTADRSCGSAPVIRKVVHEEF
jgi:hypothetical protein